MRQLESKNKVKPEIKKSKIKRYVPEKIKKEIAAKAGWKCEICQRILTANYEIDHKVALCKGGSNHIENLQSLCLECHRTKTRHEMVLGELFL